MAPEKKTDKQIADEKEAHNRRVLRGEVDPRVADLPNSEKLSRELSRDES